MKVLLDTNVLASAAATRGLCADVLREVLAEHELVVCNQVLSELERVLRDRFGLPISLISDFLSLIQQDSIRAGSSRLPKVALEDQADLTILAAAIDAGASALVTGDKEIQALREVSGLRILSPRQFWDALRSSEDAAGNT